MHDNPPQKKSLQQTLQILSQTQKTYDATKRLSNSLDLSSMTKSLAATHAAINKNFIQNDLMTVATRINEITAPFREPAVIASMRQLQEHLESSLLTIQPAILPTLTATNQLARNIAAMVAPYEGALRNIALWQESLAERMVAIQSAWALETHLDISVTGFARLARMSDAVHSPQPYEEAVSELVYDELGNGCIDDEPSEPLNVDANAVANGMNAELIAFAPGAYHEVTFAAGFRFSFKQITPPRAIAAEDPGAVFDPMDWTLLVTLENTLRTLVETELRNLEGEKWLARRVPEDMRKNWLERQEEERSDGRPVFALIQYANFMDLAHLICQKNNWPTFAHIFLKKEDFHISLQRLHPIRKAIAHGRPIGRAEKLLLVSEGTRVLQALKIARLLP